MAEPLAGSTVGSYASVAQRTPAAAQPALARAPGLARPRKPILVAPQNMPNKAGQVGPVGVKSGIINAGLMKSGR